MSGESVQKVDVQGIGSASTTLIMIMILMTFTTCGHTLDKLFEGPFSVTDRAKYEAVASGWADRAKLPLPHTVTCCDRRCTVSVGAPAVPYAVRCYVLTDPEKSACAMEARP